MLGSWHTASNYFLLKLVNYFSNTMEKSFKVKSEESLRYSVLLSGGKTIGMSDQKFKEWAEKLSDDDLKLMLDKHRGNRDFYKKIMEEDYRKEHPNSFRYKDAENKVKKLNAQGKILKELIDNRNKK